MDEVANVSPRRRKVRCPKCRKPLSEPESPIYECPFCHILLRAKGVPPDFRGESWQVPINEGNQGIENSQQTNELEAKSIIGTELIRSQSLNDHEINEHVSIDGNNRQQEQLLSVTGSVVKNRSEQELQLENDCGNKSTSADDNDMLADYASKISTTNGEDCVESKGALVSNSGVSLETHLLLDRTIPQLLLEDAGNCTKQMQTNELEAKSIDGTELIRSQSQDQLNDHEINEHVSIDGNIRQQEQLLSETGREQELQLENDCENKSTSVGDNDMSAYYASKIRTTNGEEGMAMDCVENEGALACNSGVSPETHFLLDHTIPQMLLKDAGNCSMPSASEEKKDFAGECHCDTAGEGNEQNFQSEIIRDNDYELSFKYISSALESNAQLAPRKRSSRLSKLSSEVSVRLREKPSQPMNAHLTERRPFSSDENSDEYESYSSASESASHDSMDSEFDFPSPSAQSMQTPNLSDLLFQQKMPLPDVHCAAPPNPHQLECKDVDHENVAIAFQNSNGAPSTPHQLEWQDVDHMNEEIPLQNSNGAVASSVEVDAKTVFDVLNGVDQGDQVERTEVERHLQKEEPETFSVGLEDTASIVREALHVQGENAELIGGLANIVGSVDSKERDNAETKEDYNGYQRSLSYQLKKHKPMLTNDLQEGLSGSLDLLSSGAEHSSKLKSSATLKEGITNGRMLISGTESPLCSLSDGNELENCLATQEKIKLVHSVANVKLEDSIATIARKDAVFTGRASQLKIAPHMICIEKIQERSSDPLHLRQNVLLSDANNQSQRASTSGNMSTKRDFEGAHAAQKNMEPESVGMQSFPLVTEQGNSSSHSAVNNSNSQLYHRGNYSSEARQGGNREGTVNTFDSRMHHRSNYSEETRVQSVLSNTYTSRVQKNMHNEGLHMSRPTRILEESGKIHQRHAEAAFELADGQGPWLQKQNHPADMHAMEHSTNYSGPFNGFSPGNLQPLGSTYYTDGSDSFARGVPNASLAFTYQAPSHPWMLPMMPGIHHGCHSAAPVCMACIHYQHSHLSQLPMPPCGLCLALVHQQGHTGWCNHHQAHQIQVSDQQASAPRFPRQTVHIHDTAMAIGKPLVPSARKPKHYPPLPRGSTAPYIICKGCDVILEVPTDIPLCDTEAQKVRCGACNKVAKFSVLKDSQATGNVVLESTTTNKASISTSHAIQYTEHSRQPTVSNVLQSMDSSFDQVINSGLHPPYKQGSFDSQQQISAANKRRGSLSLDEIVQATKCEVDSSDEDEFFFRILSKHSEFDSSRIFFNGFKASSSVLGASNFDGLLVGNNMPLQAPVDEKEEGLDFGAPRMSDGESLDQRSPESRMRSPENKQHFQLLGQKRHTKDSLKDEEYMEEAALDLKRKMIAEGKKPSTSLFALLNQESSKFDINMDERASFDESTSVLCSTASSSPMDDDHTRERYNAGDCGTSQTCNITSKSFGRRGPKYIARMLRRSFEDFSRGNQ